MILPGFGRLMAAGGAFALVAVSLVLAAGVAHAGAGEATPVPADAAGLDELSGFCVGGSETVDACSQSIAFLGRPGEQPVQVVARRFHDRVGQKARWLITDRIPYPPLRSNELLLVAVCERAGVLDPRIMAIVTDGGDVQWYTDVRAAWRLDGERGRFVEHPAADSRCMNDGWGL